MLTCFGKRLRKLRVDLEISLRDMAHKLEVSPAYLSGIENGKFAVSEIFLNRFLSVYKIAPEQADIYRNDAKNNLSKIQNSNADIIAALAHARLSSCELERLKRIVRQKENDNASVIK